MWLVRFSKICSYERPYSIKGTIKLTGSKELPKGICIDKFIGTWKARNVEIVQSMKRCMVTYFILVRVGT